MNRFRTIASLAFLLTAPPCLGASEKASSSGKRAVRLDPPAQRLSKLDKALELSEEQLADIQSILEATDRNVRKAVEAGNQRIRAALDDDQNSAFDDFLKEEDRRAAQTAEKPRTPGSRKRLVPVSGWESEDNAQKQGGQGGGQGGQGGGQGGQGGQGGGQGGQGGGQGGMGQGGQGGMGPNNGKCGDGVCDQVEQNRGVCPQDCN